MPNLSDEWDILGENYFRKLHLYDMQWEVGSDLSNFKIASGQMGGHIALLFDAKTTASGQQSKAFLQIYTASGRPVVKQLWKDGTVVSLGWTSTEQLLLVQENGKVAVLDMNGGFRRTFSMGEEAEDRGVLDCRFFPTYQGTGLAVLTGRHRIFCVNCVDDPRIRRLAEVPGLSRPPSSWVMYTAETRSCALVARDRDLFLLDQSGSVQQVQPPIQASMNAIIAMSVSFNQKLLALFLDTGVLWVGDIELSSCHCEVQTERAGSRPHQMAWSAAAAVLLTWPSSVLLVGPQKDVIEYFYLTHVHMDVEIDGVRLLTADRHELMQRVPIALEGIGRIGAVTPGSWLYAAQLELNQGTGLANDQLLPIRERMSEAVDQCLSAAGHAYSPDLQKALLSAARLGRGFLADHQADTFAEVCRTLAVLNNIRHPLIGMPLTMKQLTWITMPVLLDRLIARGHFPLALGVCARVRLPDSQGSNRVLAHWAYHVVETSQDELSASRQIVDRLGSRPGLSYAEIASKAKDCGKETLAEQLLDHECRASEQVPLLLKLGRYPRALAKAVDSGDPELIQFTVEALKGLLPASELLMVLRAHPTAMALYADAAEGGLMGQVLDQEDNRGQQARLALQKAFTDDRFEQRCVELQKATQLYKQARNEFMAQEVDDQLRLLRYQRRLEEEMKQPFVDLSLHQTLYQLILAQNIKMVDQLKREYRVPDRRFWWLRLEALGERGDWAEIERMMGKGKKRLPVGYEAFVEVCLKYNNETEALKYLPKLEGEKRVRYLYKLSRVDEAIDTAFSLKSEEGLAYLHQHLVKTNRPAADRVQALRAQLR